MAAERWRHCRCLGGQRPPGPLEAGPVQVCRIGQHAQHEQVVVDVPAQHAAVAVQRGQGGAAGEGGTGGQGPGRQAGEHASVNRHGAWNAMQEGGQGVGSRGATCSSSGMGCFAGEGSFSFAAPAHASTAGWVTPGRLARQQLLPPHDPACCAAHRQPGWQHCRFVTPLPSCEGSAPLPTSTMAPPPISKALPDALKRQPLGHPSQHQRQAVEGPDHEQPAAGTIGSSKRVCNDHRLPAQYRPDGGRCMEQPTICHVTEPENPAIKQYVQAQCRRDEHKS